MGLLFPEIVGELDTYAFSAGNSDMQVFVKCLRCTESFGINSAETQVTERTVADIDPRGENRSSDEVVFVNADTPKKPPMFVFPFVLEVRAYDIYLLSRFITISERFIFQVIEVVFQTGCKLGRHEQQAIELVRILYSPDCSQVRGPSVCLRVHPGAIVAVPADMLGGNICIPNMFAVLALAFITE